MSNEIFGSLVPGPAVQERYPIDGKPLSRNSLKRWEDDPDLGFPKPIRLRGKKYWLARELDAFDRRKMSERTAA